ncbi:hypothetical protein [Paucibacter soli]|uniref:hypothetical protein n=1 Tax=Paucibacter soli TaxID=3133433 RepID=UPI0030984926
MPSTSALPARAKPSSDDLAKAESIRAYLSSNTIDMDGMGADVLEAVNSLPESINAREWVRGGFSGSKFGARQLSLAEKLVRYESVRAIRLLVQHNTLGLDLDDLCTVYRNPQYKSELETISLVATSVLEADSPGGVSLALQLQPHHQDLTRLHSFGTTRATLHYIALHRGIRGEGSDGALGQGHLNCARLLLDHQAPILNYEYRDASVVGALFGAGWKGDAAFRAEVALSYFRAGLLDPNKPLPSNQRPFGSQLPLAATFRQKNAHGAAVLLAMGANVQESLPHSNTDLIEFAHKIWDDPEMVALITAGLMERRIETAAANPQQSTAAQSMRSQRLGL